MAEISIRNFYFFDGKKNKIYFLGGEKKLLEKSCGSENRSALSIINDFIAYSVSSWCRVGFPPVEIFPGFRLRGQTDKSRIICFPEGPTTQILLRADRAEFIRG